MESGRGLRGASRHVLGRILDALGRILDLLWHSSGNRMNVFYGICQDSAHVLKTCNCPHFWGFRLVRASAGSLPGSVRDLSGTRPGHAAQLFFELKMCNCRHFRCLCCFGPALALVWESFGTYSMGYVKILALVWESYERILWDMSRFCSCPENVQLSSFLGFQIRPGFCRISGGLRTGPIRALPGSVRDPSRTHPGLVRAMPRNCFLS